MKKIILLSLALLPITTSAQAVEWHAQIKNASTTNITCQAIDMKTSGSSKAWAQCRQTCHSGIVRTIAPKASGTITVGGSRCDAILNGVNGRNCSEPNVFGIALSCYGPENTGYATKNATPSGSHVTFTPGSIK